MSGQRIAPRWTRPHAAAELRLNKREKPPMADRTEPPLPAPQPRQIAEIRRRIAVGFYDRPDVARETASRMLQSRALTPEN